MDTNAAFILGVWAFAVSTVISKNVVGWFIWVAFIVAIGISVWLL